MPNKGWKHTSGDITGDENGRFSFAWDRDLKTNFDNIVYAE